MNPGNLKVDAEREPDGEVIVEQVWTFRHKCTNEEFASVQVLCGYWVRKWVYKHGSLWSINFIHTGVVRSEFWITE